MKRWLVTLLILVVTSGVLPSEHTSTSILGANDPLTIAQMGPNVHVRRTAGAFWDAIDLTFDGTGGGVQIAGIYRSSKGGELNYRAQMTRNGGYVEISNIQEIFTVRFAKRDLRGYAHTQLVSIRFGDREVAVDEQQLESSLPQLVQIAEELAQSRMLPLILDSRSLIEAARKKIARSSAKNTSFRFVQEVLAAGCGRECFECGLALAGYGVSILGLFASCGASFNAGCILALVGSRIAAVSLVLACEDCLEECIA